MTHVTDPLALLVAFILGTIGIARAVRLITSDAYPPMQVIRDRWEVWQSSRDTDDDAMALRYGITHGWGPLLTCPFCCAPYVTAFAVALTHWAGIWAPDLGTLAGWWWTLAVWAAVSYLAACFVVRDEPEPIEVD